jgi:hypothetical protein
MASVEEALRDLAAHLDIPASEFTAPRVRARLEGGHQTVRRPSLRPRLLAVAAVFVLAVLVVGAIPGARHAVADWLGVRGVHIEHRAPTVTVTSARTVEELGLGRQATLSEARRRVRGLLVPARLGAPDRVWVRDDRPEVSLVYLDGDRVGTLITEFTAGASEFFDKMLGRDATLEPVTVNGGRGVWIEGGDHFLFVRGRNGVLLEDHGRLAGNALIWEQGRVTIRLEGPFTKADALAVATSMTTG